MEELAVYISHCQELGLGIEVEFRVHLRTEKFIFCLTKRWILMVYIYLMSDCTLG